MHVTGVVEFHGFVEFMKLHDTFVEGVPCIIREFEKSKHWRRGLDESFKSPSLCKCKPEQERNLNAVWGRVPSFAPRAHEFQPPIAGGWYSMDPGDEMWRNRGERCGRARRQGGWFWRWRACAVAVAVAVGWMSRGRVRGKEVNDRGWCSSIRGRSSKFAKT